MKLFPYLTVILLGLFFNTHAQESGQVKGRVIDTASTALLQNSSIALLRAKDSTLVEHTRADAKGFFTINKTSPGAYILLVSYPKYVDYVQAFKLDENQKNLDVGNINLMPMASVLQEVIIRGNASQIKIKGDTTEFNAGAFTVQPNAKVEDLLKQFPGMEVDSKGNITAQGKKVQKVLVDGEEFFGDDPTLVTKNLRADMVDKVQLFEKSSDQAAFTGVDDGNKTTTLNVMLKEDKKTGYFGKVNAGLGNRENYAGQGMFNYFKGKQKFSLYGTASNTGLTGLGWDDQQKYASGYSGATFDDGVMYMTIGSDELESFDGRYSGEGLPTARTGGAHFSTKWNADKNNLNTNYKTGYINIDGAKQVESQNNLPTGLLYTQSNESSIKNMMQNKADAQFETKLDSTLSLKVNFDATLKNSKNESFYLSNSQRNDHSALNRNQKSLNNKVEEQLFNISAFFAKKFQKKGRTLSALFSQNLSKNNANGILNSELEFYDAAGLPLSDEQIYQNKINNLKGNTFKSNLSYTEPLSESLSMIVSYGLTSSKQESDRRSYNLDAQGQSTGLDLRYSNDYLLKQLSNQGGLFFNYNFSGSLLRVGTNLANVNLNQEERLSKTEFKRDFLNWSPQASLRLKITNGSNISVGYNGNTRQPSITQLQPIIDNSDPLNTPVGNPNLKPYFSHGFNTFYNSYKVISGQSIYLGGNFNVSQNAIVSNITTDAQGKTSFTYDNLSGKSPINYNLFGGLNRKIKNTSLSAGLGINLYGNKSYTLNNNSLNVIESSSIGPSFNISANKAKKYEASFRFQPRYVKSEFSLQPSSNSNGWGYVGNANLSFHLPGKFKISTEASYQLDPKTQAFNQKFQRFLLDLELSKSFLKDESLVFSVKGYDIFKQNTGFRRSAVNSSIMQTQYSTITRYVLFSLIWDFNKMGPGSK